ncbi:MAG: copper resistance protein B [Vicinamibacterales bacterium]
MNAPGVLAVAAVAAVLGGSVAATAQQPAPPPSGAHAGHEPAPPAPPASGEHDHAASQEPPASPAPPVTPDDRAAAFPPVHPHAMEESRINSLVLFDQFEWQTGHGARGLSVDASGWVGTDLDRFWFRAEGDRPNGRFEQAQVQALYGRAVSPWWTFLAGVRQDVRPGEPRTAGAVGIQGLAPYWIELAATAYIEAGGRSHLRVEVEHDALLTRRVVLQPLLEFEIYSRGDRALGLGRGLSTVDAGLRLRYEVRREFAPYLGLNWHGRFFGTKAGALAAGLPARGAELAVGVRFWR